MRKYLKRIFRQIYLFFSLKIQSKKKSIKLNKVIFITEGSNWVIERISNYIISNIKTSDLEIKADFSPEFYINSIIHFGSIHIFVRDIEKNVHPSNKIIATIHHGNFGYNPDIDYFLDTLLKYQHKLEKIVASNSIMRKRLISWGIPDKKISLIPIGVDLDHFKSLAKDKRKTMRKKLGIPEDAICIGSFQKDGLGWGEGLEPKLIKGPDVFIDAILRMAKNRKIHVLLTGPARGYIKKALSNAGIPFTYRFLKDYPDIVNYYNCLDFYLVTSREEGGPKAIMESMATGVPVVTTRVGMAPDIIKNNDCGIMVEIEDVNAMVSAAESILNNSDLRERLIKEGIEKVKQYDWSNISKQYTSLYQKVIDE